MYLVYTVVYYRYVPKYMDHFDELLTTQKRTSISGQNGTQQWVCTPSERATIRE